MTTNYDKIVEILENSGIEYRIVNHESTEFEPNLVAKTLCFEANNKIYLFVLRIHDRLDYKKVSKILGVNRTKIKMLSVDALAQMGYRSGEVSPIALQPEIYEYIDTNVFGSNYIFCGCGDGNKSLKIYTKDLPLITRYTIDDISK